MPVVQMPAVKACPFVPVSELIPRCWRPWFFSALLDFSPEFSWGDNNRTMISAGRFRDALEEVMESLHKDVRPRAALIKRIVNVLNQMEEARIYVDLEN